MAISVFLDDVDITADLNKQFALPAGLYDGIYPGKTRNQWYDLLPAIAAHPELRDNFFNTDDVLHSLVIKTGSDTEYTARIIVSMKYSSRNR